MAQQPLLDLSTLLDNRPPIRIDGETYFLKSADELSLYESQQFTAWGKQLEELGAEPDRRDALDALVKVVAKASMVGVPAGVLDKLSGTQLMSVVQVFTSLLLGQRLRLAGALAEQVMGQRIGANLSPGSSMPSVATSTGGSSAHRLHS